MGGCARARDQCPADTSVYTGSGCLSKRFKAVAGDRRLGAYEGKPRRTPSDQPNPTASLDGEVMKRPKIVIAEQRLLMLEGLQRIVEPEFEVIYTARDGRTLVSAVEKAPPDVVLTDTVLPLLSGIEAVFRSRRSLPNIRAVFLSREPDRQLLGAAVHAGAAGYLVTDCSANELVAALHEVVAGRSYITPLIGRRSPVTIQGWPGHDKCTKTQRTAT